MEKSNYIVLKKTYSYCTYQLFAYMANKNTLATDGIKIAALTCLEWLNKRMGGEYFQQLIIGELGDYKKIKNEQFTDIHIDKDYSIDIVANIDDGFWALRICEPDNGFANKEKQPVKGRMIQSDIAFRIVEDKLQCGFRVTITDSDKEMEKAPCIRFSIIKKLIENPAFGLEHEIKLNSKANRINNETELKKLTDLIISKNNQLPIIVFTSNHLLGIKDIFSQGSSISRIDSGFTIRKATIEKTNNNIVMTIKEKPNELKISDIDHRIEGIAKGQLGYSHQFYIFENLFDDFINKIHYSKADKKDIFIIEPKCFNGKISHQKINFGEFVSLDNVKNYSREKVINYHDVLFVNEAKAYSNQLLYEMRLRLQEMNEQLQNDNESLKARNERNNRIQTYYSQGNKNDLLKQSNKELIDTIEVLKEDNNKLAVDLEKAILKATTFERKIAFLEGKQKYPKNHKDIEFWVQENYSNKIILNSKAIKDLQSNNATRVSVDVICDAIDYLANVYYYTRFSNFSEEVVNELSSIVYGKGYNVSPSGIDKEKADSSCKIRYNLDGGKTHELVLDYHLKVGGSKDSDMLRIYFIHDDNLKKLIIGRLPNHLNYTKY